MSVSGLSGLPVDIWIMDIQARTSSSLHQSLFRMRFANTVSQQLQLIFDFISSIGLSSVKLKEILLF